MDGDIFGDMVESFPTEKSQGILSYSCSFYIAQFPCFSQEEINTLPFSILVEPSNCLKHVAMLQLVEKGVQLTNLWFYFNLTA